MKEEMVNFKQLMSVINKQQADFDNKLKPLTKLNNANSENKNLKKNIEDMTEQNEKQRSVAKNLAEENERYEIECGKMKVVIENLQQKTSTINKEKTDFDEKFKILSNNFESVLVEKQGLLESFEKLEAENYGFKKLAEDNEVTK